jgi:hypothetical protein
MSKNSLVVSDEVIWCYKHINVIPIDEQISKLSDYDKYLLCLMSIDFYNEENDFFIRNMKLLEYFIDRVILVMEGNFENINEDIKKIQKDLEDDYLTLNNLTTKEGSKLPDPTTELEAKRIRRNFTIDRLFE